jgi:predicted peroxiredoxin
LICSDGEEEAHVKNLVQEVNDSRITYHHTIGKKDGDFGNTVRKQMLEKVRGSYVLFFDDDNIILPDYFSKMVKAVRDSGKDFAVCKVMHFGPLNPVAGKPPVVLEGNPVKLYHIDPLQILVKAEVMKKIGWDTEVGYLSDGVTLEKLGNQFQHVRVEEVLGVHI